METRTFTTPIGEIWLTGETDAFDSDRVLVLIIKGAFAREGGRFSDLHELLPEASVLVAQLPGNFCPALAETSVEGFAFAFDHVIATAFPGRKIVILGDSLGGLVALAVAGDVTRLVLDPPLKLSADWPIMPRLRERFVAEPAHRDFLSNVFGVTERGIEERDYTALLGRPARVLIGEVTTERPDEAFFVPSVVLQPERDLLSRHGEIRLSVVENVGHLIVASRPLLVLQVLKELLAEIDQCPGHRCSMTEAPQSARR